MKYCQYLFYIACICCCASNSELLARSPNAELKASFNKRPSLDSYQRMRDLFVEYERSRQLGSLLNLNEEEKLANQVIMKAKIKEYNEGLITPHLFAPSQHIFSVLDKIKNSELFKLLQYMPKGGVLHAHDTALCSTNYLIELTYREYLWGCWNSIQQKFLELKFSKIQPTTEHCYKADVKWIKLNELRNYFGKNVIDNILRQQFTLYPKEKYIDNNQVWKSFTNIFNLLDGLLFYKPNWADYYYKALEEFLADGVQYLEFRSTLPILYDLEGNEFTELDTVSVYNETLERFMLNNSDFIGSKLIYAPLRHVSNERMDHYVEICKNIKKIFPHFLAGFDLVGQEELGRPLKDFVPKLLQMPENIEFLFHAGETNWFGSTVDENLIDAFLLGAKRIGHGFALLKHPVVLRQLKLYNISIEINPISNQVLQLITDFRNHPMAHLFADNYPIVISSDDPSFWMTTPLTHDFYIAFLGIASANSDLKLLKQLAINSIKYSMLSSEQQDIALNKWEFKWNKFIEKIINETHPINENRENNEVSKNSETYTNWKVFNIKNCYNGNCTTTN